MNPGGASSAGGAVQEGAVRKSDKSAAELKAAQPAGGGKAPRWYPMTKAHTEQWQPLLNAPAAGQQVLLPATAALPATGQAVLLVQAP
eukprot:3859100-Prymnesium_polylepis.1